MNPPDDPRIAHGMRAQLAARRERLAAGDRPLGWKVGFGAPAAMEKLSISAPLVGFLMQRACVASGDTVSLRGWTRPVAEPEIAVYLGRDVPGGGDRAAAADAIVALGPAIELADVDHPPEDVQAILSGNIFQRHVLLGARDEAWAGGRVDGLTGRLYRQGGEIARTETLEANTGKLVDLVRHVADLLAAFGERLCAGEVVIAGSVVPPVFVETGDDLEFILSPIGRVAVRFARAR